MNPVSASGKRRVALGMALLCALPAWAQAATPAPELTSPPEDLGMGMLLVRTLIVLGVVVVLIYLTLNVGLRRLMGLKAVGGQDGVVKVLERHTLEVKRSLYVVEAAGEYFLVGSSEGGLSLVSKLDAAEVQRLRAEQGGRPAGLVPFWERLKAKQGGTPPPPTA